MRRRRQRRTAAVVENPNWAGAVGEMDRGWDRRCLTPGLNALKGEEACVHSCEDRSCKNRAGNLLWQKEGHPVWTHQKCASKHPNCTVQCLGWTWLERAKGGSQMLCSKLTLRSCNSAVECVHTCERRKCLKSSRSLHRHQQLTSKHPNCTSQCLGWAYLSTLRQS